MQGFKTCADVAKAEQEGEVVIYATNPEQAELKVLARFSEMFPKIKPTYLRLQAGALYAKVLAERQAQTIWSTRCRSPTWAWCSISRKSAAISLHLAREPPFKEGYKSVPEGFWTWGTMIMAGIAYNPNVVSAADAPKTWQDLLDPKWKGAVSVKVSNSGLQHVSWFELRQLYGPDYWKKFAELKPRAFDCYVQQFDRLVNQQDKVIHTAQYAGYLEWKAKGAPVAFVMPPAGCRGPRKLGGCREQHRTRTPGGCFWIGSCPRSGRRRLRRGFTFTRCAPTWRRRPAGCRSPRSNC